MPLGTKVRLGPGHIVLDGDPASFQKVQTPSFFPKGAQPPPKKFGPCLLWPNGWMDQDATWYGGRHRPRPHCVRWGSSSPRKAAQLPDFQPISIVAKRSPISAAGEHLYIILTATNQTRAE